MCRTKPNQSGFTLVELKLKEEFESERIRMHKEFRALKSEQTAPSCEQMHQQFVTLRLMYVEKLNQLLQLC